MALSPSLTLFLLLGCSVPGLIQGIQQIDMSGLVGEMVKLPCRVDTKNCGQLHSIKWYRGSSRIFVFSEMSMISHAEGQYNERVALHYVARSPESSLEVKKLQVGDEAVYKCEITYMEVREGCSVIQFINLTSLIKPQYLRVRRGDGTEVPNDSSIGPFNEGDELTLECESGNGKPIPAVHWYNGSHRMHGQYEWESGANSVGTGRNRIRVSLGRGDLGARYECRAESAALPSPMVSSTTVLVHVRPLSLNMTGVEKYAVEGTIVTLRCVVKNALPAADITWYNGTTPYADLEVDPETNYIKNFYKTHAPSYIFQEEPDQTVTTISELRFTASTYDNDVTLRCEAINAVMKAKDEKPLRSHITMEVLYPPIVHIESRTEDMVNVTVNETEHIALFCNFDANPKKIDAVKWLRDGIQIQTNNEHYEAAADDTGLLIKNATRYDQGEYTCAVTNSVGEGVSRNSINVAVYYKPQVRLLMEPPSPVSELAALNITLTCSVEQGNPPTLLAVRWFLSGDILQELPQCNNASFDGTTTFCDVDPSRLLLENVVRGFHGNYSCVGKNEAGWGVPSPEEELVVYYPPGPASLVYEPANVVKRSNVTLSCSVNDTGRPETTVYKWTRGAHHLQEITTPNMTIDPVTLETQANFTCYAINAGGNGEPASVYINVSAPPGFIERLPLYYGALYTNQYINISCRVECSPSCDIMWLKNDERLDTGPGTKYSVLEEIYPPDVRTNDFESIKSTLVWNMTAWESGQLDRLNDNANYTCKSTANAVGSGVQSTTLFGVEYPPENISLSTYLVNVVENSIPEKVMCTAKGYPNASYHWIMDGSPEIITKGNILNLNMKMTRHRSGNYTCRATNKHGSIDQNVTIDVLYKPECGISQTEYDGKMVLTCTATANPPDVDFMWLIKGENESIEENVYKKGQQSQLILETYVENFRTYICVANNTIGFSVQCERDVTGHVIGWWKNFETDNYKIIIAVIVGAILMVVIVCITIIVVCRRKRSDDKLVTFKKLDAPSNIGVSRKRKKPGSGPSPLATKDKSKQDLAMSPSDGLLQPDGDKAFYENLPFHGMQSAPNKPATLCSNTQASQSSRPPSQLSQYGSSGYGSTRSHMGPHLQKSQSIAHSSKDKFNSLRVYPHKKQYPQFYSMRLHHRYRNRGGNRRSLDKQQGSDIPMSPLTSRNNPNEIHSYQQDANSSESEVNNNASMPPERCQPPVPAPRKQSKSVIHTYQNVPPPVIPKSTDSQEPKTQSQFPQRQSPPLQQHHQHFNLDPPHNLLMPTLSDPSLFPQLGTSRRRHANRAYLPPTRLEYQQPHGMTDPYASERVVYADLTLEGSVGASVGDGLDDDIDDGLGGGGGSTLGVPIQGAMGGTIGGSVRRNRRRRRRDSRHLPSHHRPTQPPTEYAILKFHDVGQEIDV